MAKRGKPMKLDGSETRYANPDATPQPKVDLTKQEQAMIAEWKRLGLK